MRHRLDFIPEIAFDELHVRKPKARRRSEAGELEKVAPQIRESLVALLGCEGHWTFES